MVYVCMYAEEGGREGVSGDDGERNGGRRVGREGMREGAYEGGREVERERTCGWLRTSPDD